MKSVVFAGDARDAIRSFPENARREAGFQIERVQRGLEPDHWKPMATVGRGVREIRITDRAGAFRVIYVATFADAVYILHAFQKKPQATPRRDLDLAVERYGELMRRMKT
ncbi:MAG TPA: type II toxin-antitoxin system RelE/ParE family toxin [Rhizomicrobium sp.]|nr:type II toxin-antitoxin system RelE/ParE family toxin [Rhizomicrobium sp.]